MKLQHLLTPKVTGYLSPFVIAGALLLSACTKSPLDAPMLMGKGQEAFALDMAERKEKMRPLEVEAFNWAVDGLSYEQLIKEVPNKSPREVIRLAISNSKAIYDKEFPENEKAVVEYETVRDELKKITTSDLTLHNQKTFFGHMPKLKFSADNNSKFDIGSMYWIASLYINGSDKPEARRQLSMFYKNSKPLAMKAGNSYTESHNIGFVSGDPEWTSQTVLQASTNEVRVQPYLEKILDLDGNSILPPSPFAKRDELKVRAELHKRFAGI